MLKVGLVSGNVRCWMVAPWQALARASSMGSIFTCVSTKSLGVVLSVPIIASTAVCLILVRFQRNVTAPDSLV